jgi:hypothetical protein
MYMARAKSKDICTECEMTKSQLANLIKTKGWVDIRNDLEEEAQENFIQTYKSIIQRNRIEVVNRHLNISRKIDKKIEQMVDRKDKDGKPYTYTPDAILSISRAIKSSSDVAARAVGLSDRIDPIAQDAQNNKASIISINVNVESVPHSAQVGIVSDAEFNVVKSDKPLAIAEATEVDEVEESILD